MRAGPSESVYRSWFQTTLCCISFISITIFIISCFCKEYCLEDPCESPGNIFPGNKRQRQSQFMPYDFQKQDFNELFFYVEYVE
jgi:hypothetical protein